MKNITYIRNVRFRDFPVTNMCGIFPSILLHPRKEYILDNPTLFFGVTLEQNPKFVKVATCAFVRKLHSIFMPFSFYTRWAKQTGGPSF